MRIGLPMLRGTASRRSRPTRSTMACAQRSALLKTTARRTFVSADRIVETLIRRPPCANCIGRRDMRASPTSRGAPGGDFAVYWDHGHGAEAIDRAFGYLILRSLSASCVN